MLLDFAELDFKNKGELYHSLYKCIRDAAVCGAIKKGEKLPSIREAASQLGISRTTVENAYMRLCIEGFAESQAQKGYFITGNKGNTDISPKEKSEEKTDIKYDFSSRSIDMLSSDADIWKRMVRRVLWDSGELTSYGDCQGELALRIAIADYSYKARGVIAKPENIVIGAGIGPLLNILCGLIGRKYKVGLENGGFDTAESIFSDYGIETKKLEYDLNGATIESVEKSKINLLFLMPSALSRISPASLSKRRNRFANWAQKENRLIVEDDYNGELRYTARAVPAFQSKLPEKTVYIGSFSKLLLPSVRIAYMVLPDFLAERFEKKKENLNGTCGKVEQLALKEYIVSGALEKHLRRLRRLYNSKSRILCEELKKYPEFKKITLYESSLSIVVETALSEDSIKICNKAEEKSLRIMQSDIKGAVRLCFGGIESEKISSAVKLLAETVKELKNRKNTTFSVEK